MSVDPPCITVPVDMIGFFLYVDESSRSSAVKALSVLRAHAIFVTKDSKIIIIKILKLRSSLAQRDIALDPLINVCIGENRPEEIRV